VLLVAQAISCTKASATLPHLAIAFCRCMNIPDRYCTGYLSDVDVPVDINPTNFSALVRDLSRCAATRSVVTGRGCDAADVAMSTDG
jgi:hypothetical protein